MSTTVNRANIPSELTALPNWVMWKLVTSKGKPDKPPLRAIPKNKGDDKLDYAKTDDQATWVGFDNAWKIYDEDGDEYYSGIGIVINDGLIGFDFDNVVRDGKPEPYVLEILKHLGNPYAEYSPSGNGLHAWVFSTLPLNAELDEDDSGKKFFKKGEKYGVEVYRHTKYFTVTGDKFGGHGIPTRQSIDMAYFMCSQIANERLKSLWMGDWQQYKYPSQSEADMALIGILYDSLGDPEKTAEYFRASRLYRPDKEKKSPRYVESTVEKVQKNRAAQPRPNQAKELNRQPARRVLTLTPASQIEKRRKRWLWKNRIAEKLNLIVGNPDEAKSLTTEYIVAHVTTGDAWFDGPNENPPSKVIMFCGEDDWDDTICARLCAAGANMDKVLHPQFTELREGESASTATMRLDEDIKELERVLVENPDVRLIVIDPISNYLGGASMWDEKDIRAEVLMPLKELANRRHIAVIGVMHLNKKVDLDAIHRIGGAMAFVGVARMVWLCAHIPDKILPDGTKEVSEEYAMVKVKGNIVQKHLKGLTYAVKVQPVEVEGELEPTPYVKFVGEIDHEASDLCSSKRVLEKEQKPKREAHRPDEKKQRAIHWLKETLLDGEKHLLKEIEEDGDALHGFSTDTLLRARQELGVVTEPITKEASDGRKRKAYVCRLPAEIITEAMATEEAFL